MKITASDVKKLRDETGSGMMDCKKALQEANGDFQAAVDILRKKGQKVVKGRPVKAITIILQNPDKVRLLRCNWRELCVGLLRPIGLSVDPCRLHQIEVNGIII